MPSKLQIALIICFVLQQNINNRGNFILIFFSIHYSTIKRTDNVGQSVFFFFL